MTEYPRDLCIHQLIEAQVRRTPDAEAVRFHGESLTYAELDARANQLSHRLRMKGVGPEFLVGLCVERSLDMVVGLLGILKTGGAYVPLDPAYPPDRIRYILEDAGVKMLITQDALRGSLVQTGAELITVDSGLPEPACQPDEHPKGNIGSRNLAYVIYTSGSTGRPKGVQVEHRSVVNFLCSMQREPGLSADDVLVAVTTLSFDIAGLEMYLPLITGARLVIASREATQDGRRLAEMLRDAQVTVMQATPATWRLLIESGWMGNPGMRILCGGEALSPELARDLVKRAHSVWNLYGPTETTIWSSIYRVRGGEERSIPIGGPIANTALYVLDDKRQPVAAGQEGELYIGGEGLARGYFERRELTAGKFVADPFSQPPDARMYKTGDLVRSRGDGMIEFLGRLDHQVKIRGFRIELGEIEAVLEQHPSVKQAVVVAREDKPGEKFLAAYLVFVSGNVPSRSELRQHLRQSLPDYMLPAAFVPLETFPLTPNGKVDRKLLPAPQATDFDFGGEYLEPRDSIERKLVRMWEEVLGIHPIGVRTSFFDLGGRSLLAARLFMEISRQFGEDIPLSALFEAPTIEELAQRLRAKRKDFIYRTLVVIQASGSRPPFFCVHGGTGNTLFLHRLSGAMGPDQAFYSFEPEGLDGGRIARTTIEALAAHYIAEMRKVQPHGPYHLGGYCFGGLVAFEMAQQLLEQGDSAEMVVMFSAPLRFNRPPTERPYKPEGADRIANQEVKRSGGRLQRALRWRLQRLRNHGFSTLHKLACRCFVAAGIKVPQQWRQLHIARVLRQAEEHYSPVFYPGKLVIFRGGGLYDHDPGLGWGSLAADVEDYVIGTAAEQKTRRDIMNPPLVHVVAARLSACMDGVQVLAANGEIIAPACTSISLIQSAS